jgi:hypothetical protein
MGENEGTEVKSPSAVVPPAAEKPEAQATAKKDKKKDKKPSVTPDAMPHVTGRLLHLDVGANGVAFAIKGKKGQTEEFNLKGMELTTVPAVAAVLAGLVASKTKLRVEFSATNETGRIVKKIRAQS